MNQPPLFLEDRTSYLANYNGKHVRCWRMGGEFIFDSYKIVNNVDIIKRLGNEKERFG